MKCTQCEISAAQHELIDGLCHKCTAANLKGAKAELDKDEFPRAELVAMRADLAESNRQRDKEHAELIRWMAQASGWCESHKSEKEYLRAQLNLYKRENVLCSALRASLQECLGYIEMRLAHSGSMDVKQIMEELKRVQSISSVETSHHLGCAETTRRVDLAKARSLLEDTQSTCASIDLSERCAKCGCEGHSAQHCESPFPQGHAAQQRRDQDWSILANQVVGAEI